VSSFGLPFAPIKQILRDDENDQRQGEYPQQKVCAEGQ